MAHIQKTQFWDVEIWNGGKHLSTPFKHLQYPIATMKKKSLVASGTFVHNIYIVKST